MSRNTDDSNRVRLLLRRKIRVNGKNTSTNAKYQNVKSKVMK